MVWPKVWSPTVSSWLCHEDTVRSVLEVIHSNQLWMNLILMIMIQRLVTVLKQRLVTVVKQRLVTVVKQRLVTVALE